jgi:hypothetical protein
MLQTVAQQGGREGKYWAPKPNHYTGKWLYLGNHGRPLGGASGALAPGADFEGAPKRQSPTGHTLIRSTIAW